MPPEFAPGDDTGWMSAAACEGMDQTLWFPPKGWTAGREVGNREDGPYALAREVCDECPVRERCLEYAIAYEGRAGENERGGMWGGKTPRERHEIARKRPWPCSHCNRLVVFPKTSRSTYCSDRCRKLAQNEMRAVRREAERTDERKSLHGRRTKAGGGCKCVSCRNWRRTRARAQRARIAAQSPAVDVTVIADNQPMTRTYVPRETRVG